MPARASLADAARCLAENNLNVLIVNDADGKLLGTLSERDIAHGLIVHDRPAGTMVVDDEGNLLGMLSEFDCMKVALDAGYHGNFGGPVRDYMSDGVKTVDADMSIIDLAQVFINEKFRRFPVMHGTRLVGQISRRDVLRALESIAKG